MLIRTTKELKQLPVEAVLLSTRRNKKYGHHYLIYLVSDELATIDGVFHSLTKKELGKYLPARLIHPRRFDDHDLGTAATAIEQRRQLNSRADSITLANTVLTALEEEHQ